MTHPTDVPYHGEFELRESQRPGDWSTPENLTVKGWAVGSDGFDIEVTNWHDDVVANITVHKDGTITINHGKVAS